jgi:hypothetical protein
VPKAIVLMIVAVHMRAVLSGTTSATIADSLSALNGLVVDRSNPQPSKSPAAPQSAVEEAVAPAVLATLELTGP